MQGTRREFLASASLSALAAGSVLGQTTDSRSADRNTLPDKSHASPWPLEDRLRVLRTKTGLKITSIETSNQPDEQ